MSKVKTPPPGTRFESSTYGRADSVFDMRGREYLIPEPAEKGLDGDKPITITGTEECRMTGDITVFLSDKRAIRFDRRQDRRNVLDILAEHVGAIGVGKPVDVIQYGRKVGELPSFWSPAWAKSSSFLYEYRQGDLTLENGEWVASETLGSDDLDCLIGFVRKPAA